jgi:hypothetical protein
MNLLVSLTEKIYTWLAILTMALGFIVAVAFTLSLIIGGSAGESVAVLSGNTMKWGIRLASIATLAGIVNIYLKNQHTLTLNAEEAETEIPIEPPTEGAILSEK